MSIAIVIPAKNEEKFLPLLLTSIAAQTVKPDEVFVVDSHSTDDTVKEALKFNDILSINILEPNEKGVAAARNAGARAAASDYIVFIDADVTVPPNFIERITHSIETRGLEVGAISQRIMGDNKGLKAGGRLMNGYLRLMAPTPWPIFFSCYFMKKTIHDKIGGFDPGVFVMEDYDYALRGKRAGGKFGIVRGTFFYSSPRRYEGASGGKSIRQGLYAEFYRYTHGLSVRKRLFDYDMGGEAQDKNKKNK